MKNLIPFFAAAMMLFAFSVQASTLNNGKGDDHTTVVKADFKGGKSELAAYIKANLIYPEYARQNALQGQVVISFFVLADGTIHGARVVDGIDKKCDELVLKLINQMPKWTPATKNGQAFASKNYLTVDFKLEI